MKINNICPATIRIETESYGQEMSAGDPIRFRKVIKSGPHQMSNRFKLKIYNAADVKVEVNICSKCGCLYV